MSGARAKVFFGPVKAAAVYSEVVAEQQNKLAPIPECADLTFVRQPRTSPRGQNRGL